jgi:hypothetical protein
VSAAVAEEHAAHPIAQPSDFLRIGRGTEALGKVEELLPLAFDWEQERSAKLP